MLLLESFPPLWVHTHARAHVHTPYAHTHTRTRTHAHAHMHMRLHTHAHMHTPMHRHACMHTCTCTCAHTRTCVCTCTCTHIHEHTCTCALIQTRTAGPSHCPESTSQTALVPRKAGWEVRPLFSGGGSLRMKGCRACPRAAPQLGRSWFWCRPLLTQVCPWTQLTVLSPF